MRSLTYIAVILGFLLAKCAPNELPEDIVGDPIFYAEGTLNGEPFSLAAGPNNVQVLSSNDITPEELPIFSIELSHEGCVNCESLNIEIVGNVFTDGASDEEILPAGEYDIVSGGISSFQGEYIFDFPQGLGQTFTLFSEESSEFISINSSEPFSALPGMYNFEYVYLNGLFSCATFVSGTVVLGDDGSAHIPQITTGSDAEGDYIDVSGFTNSIMIVTDIDGTQVPILLVDDYFYLESFTEFEIEPSEISSLFILGIGGFEEFAIGYQFEDGFSIGCLDQLEIITDFELAPLESLSVAVTYSDINGIEHFVPFGTDDFFLIHDLTPYSEDPLDREAYLLNFSCGVSLSDSQSSTLQLEITEGIIPVVFE